MRQSCNSRHKFGTRNFRYSGKLQFSRWRASAKLIIDVVVILYSVFIMAYRSLLEEAIIFSITTKISISNYSIFKYFGYFYSCDASNWLIGNVVSILGILALVILGHWVFWPWVFWDFGYFGRGHFGWVFLVWVFRGGTISDSRAVESFMTVTSQNLLCQNLLGQNLLNYFYAKTHQPINLISKLTATN